MNDEQLANAVDHSFEWWLAQRDLTVHNARGILVITRDDQLLINPDIALDYFAGLN